MSNFIGKLPFQWNTEQLLKTPGRINMLREGVVTMIGIKRLESEALFVSSEGGGTLRETAKVNFAGQERYWWIARKFAGVLRRVLLTELAIDGCTTDTPCIKCAVCGLLGGLNTTSNQSLASRLKLQDLISLEIYDYDEKFRIRQPDNPNTSNPVPFQEVVVPPGTHFPFVVRLIKPSRFDIGAFLYANSIADAIGYGNYSKLRGDATTQWVAIFDGFAHVSVYDLLSNGNDLSATMNRVAQSPMGPVKKENTLQNLALQDFVGQMVNAKEAWQIESGTH